MLLKLWVSACAAGPQFKQHSPGVNAALDMIVNRKEARFLLGAICDGNLYFQVVFQPRGDRGPGEVVKAACLENLRLRARTRSYHSGFKETKVSIVGSLRDREVACSASDRQGSNFESCVWRTVSSQSSHHPQEVLLAQFSLYVHKSGLKPDSFHFIFQRNKSFFSQLTIKD